jgi:hypothetical protein
MYRRTSNNRFVVYASTPESEAQRAARFFSLFEKTAVKKK